MGARRLFGYESDLLLPLCRELDAWKTRLDYRGPLPRRWEGRLRRDLEADAIAASTIMEGVNVTVDEVRRILVGDVPTEVPPEDASLVLGYRDAMQFVLRQADDATFEWDRGLLVGLHDRAMAGRFPVAGRLRSERAVYIVDRTSGARVFLPPPGDDVAGLVDRTLAVMESGHAHPAIAAAWIHVALAAVHPFEDGNGRSARICASLAMYRGGFARPEFTSLEEWWGYHLEDYYGLFACLGDAFDPDADVTPFMVGHVEAQLRQVRALDLTQKVQGQVWVAAETIVEDAGLDARVANALWEAFFGRSVTAGYYRALADVSPATATSDLRAAVAAGFLDAAGERRGRRYLAGPRLYERLAKALGLGADDVAASDARDRIVSILTERVIEMEAPPDRFSGG